MPLCISGEAAEVKSGCRGGREGGGDGLRCCLGGKDSRELNRGAGVDPAEGGPGCLGDVSEMSPEVDELVALEEVVVVVVVVAVVVPRARWSDPAKL